MKRLTTLMGSLTFALMASSAALAWTPTDGRPFDGQTVKVLAVKSSQFEAQQARLRSFSEATGIKVQIDYVPFANMKDALTAEMVGGGGDYDVVSVMDQWTGSMEMLLSPIEDGVKAHHIDLADYPAAFLRQGYVGGQLVGLPVRAHVQLLFYRKDLFAQAGLTPPKTWDELTADGKVIREKFGVSGIALPYGKLSGQNLMVWINLLWGQGGQLLDAQGKPLFNSEAGVKATQQYIDMLLKDRIAPAGSATFVEQDAVNSFKQGNSAMLAVWWWVRSQLTAADQSKINDGQLGFTTLPQVPGAKATTYANTWIFGITSGSKHRAAAMEYLTWLTDKSLERDILLDPKLNEVVAVHFANLRDAEVNVRWGGMHQSAAVSLESAPALKYDANWPRVSEILETAISSLASGQSTDVKGTLDRAAQQIAAIR